MSHAAFAYPAPVSTAARKARVARCTRRPIVACARPAARLPTMNDVQDVAEGQGFRVERYAAGPVCRLHLFRGDELYAFITAVILPTGWLHIESYKAKAKEDGGLLSVTPGMLVFMFALAFGANRGCKEVYGLAIRDESQQHARLKRYLKRFGGKEVRRITENVHCIPDRLLYGGLGMIIKGDINDMLTRAAAMLSRVVSRPEAERGYTVTRWPKGMKPPEGAEV